MEEHIFLDFLNKQVKVPYQDGKQFKIARGVLELIQNGFVKINGPLGTVVINEKNIEKMSEVKND